jgi:hypothetical protein
VDGTPLKNFWNSVKPILDDITEARVVESAVYHPTLGYSYFEAACLAAVWELSENNPSNPT